MVNLGTLASFVDQLAVLKQIGDTSAPKLPRLRAPDFDEAHFWLTNPTG